MKQVTIIVNDEPLVLNPEQTIEVNEDFPKEIRSGYVERAGDTFFGTFVFDMDAATMKAGRSVAVRWTDPLRGKQVVRKISLAGFTRCFDECIRRYREDRR